MIEIKLNEQDALFLFLHLTDKKIELLTEFGNEKSKEKSKEILKKLKTIKKILNELDKKL
jgi:hypothetical protein